MMEYSEQFMEHIEYTFAAFCNVVLRNTAINAYRDFGRSRSTANYWKLAALKQLRKELEKTKHEE